MIVSKKDFNNYTLTCVLADAQFTSITAIIGVGKGTVSYLVETLLEPSYFVSKEELGDAFMFSRYKNSFTSLEEAIDIFNTIQKLSEEGKLVRITGA